MSQNPCPLGIGGSPQDLTVPIGTSAYGLSVTPTGANAGLAGEMTSDSSLRRISLHFDETRDKRSIDR